MPQVPRVESGPIRFGSDWTGLFLRGDDAVVNGLVLKSYLQTHKDPTDLYYGILMDFANTLLSSDERQME